jgi:hypothetical protein
MDNLLFLIESGRPLELVKQHIAEKERVRQSNLQICHDLGVTSAYLDRMTGVVLGVVFSTPDQREGWKKADRQGVSFPKKGSEWHKRLKAQVGYADPSEVIGREFNIPTSLDYTDPKSDSSGWRLLGHPLRACGFLWISKDGPYAMWIPDVPGEVATSKADGFVVKEPANSFKPEIPGCRPMLEEEWEFLCADDNLQRKRQEMAPAA